MSVRRCIFTSLPPVPARQHPDAGRAEPAEPAVAADLNVKGVDPSTKRGTFTFTTEEVSLIMRGTARYRQQCIDDMGGCA